MNKPYLLKTPSKLLYFVLFNVSLSCMVYATSDNFIDNSQRMDALSYKYDTFDPLQMSDLHMLDLEKKQQQQHNATCDEESSLNELLINFIDKSLNLTYYELAPGIFVLRNNDTVEAVEEARSVNDQSNLLQHLIKFAESHVISVPLSLSESTGRLFFFKGIFTDTFG